MSSSALATNIFILQVLISTMYIELCATLQQLFSTVDMPFILFKNIVRNGPQGTQSFHPSQSTFIEELNDQCTKAHLETLAKCNIQVVGVLKAKNAYFPPYEISCSTCHHSLPFDAAIDMDFVHCMYCNADTQTSCHHNILCTLNTQEGNIDCSLQGDILQQTYPDITDITYEQYQQDISPMVFMLRRLHVYGTFTLAVNNTIIDIVKQ
ncbi:uncharacterized protein LOC131040330 isoform X1 [Cryptomeria japonica]|uniref:uncharacterized protein LOC131040330 isoform X1 n=2 Tax=Cryptomeria japonica TaxID=3369 RepID=UPI0027DA83C4|nr:uncharacterized protein LOC131040330 isoform X1 [Cryptomeria japonica]